MPSIKELLMQQKRIQENRNKPKRKPRKKPEPTDTGEP